MERVLESIKRIAKIVKAPDGKKYYSLSLEGTKRIAHRFRLRRREVEIMALEAEIIPERYQRNIGTVGIKGQAKLLRSSVAVVGAGGLGGMIIELLARMGIGNILVIDGDSFVENNLNRQILSREANLGINKAEAASQRVQEINSSTECIFYPLRVTARNLKKIIKEADIVVDALDDLKTRFFLEQACKELGLPLVHGAIAGFVGQVMTIYPGDAGLRLIYGGGRRLVHQGIEVALGNPAATPAMVAAWEVQEVVKVLLGIGEPLRNRLLYMDAEIGSVEIISLL